MKTLLKHLRIYILRGLFAIIPLALTAFALNLLYTIIDKRITGVVEKFIGFSFPGLGVILLLAILYFLGLGVSNVLGRQFVSLLDGIANRIPLVKTTYKVGRQLSSTLSLPEKQVFKRAVLVEYLKPGMWTIGFVTGRLIDRSNNDEVMLKVFIPTPPNPISGTMILVRESQTRDPGWTIEEALKAVISGGVISPAEIKVVAGEKGREQLNSMPGK
ncbi:MAG: DUF502 domain-containing protein [Deltaproteobacteria bacterium]|nr:MAG: DUF502 domain-containing protein [Deltaproteobacteria bacterium]